MTMSISRRAPAAAVAVAVALTLPLAVSGSPQNEEFFESSFDGAWVGSIKVGNERVLVQLNLNVGSSAVGFAVIQNNLGSTPNGVDVLAADFTKVSNKSIVFRADDAAPLRRRRDTTTFKLSPKSGTLKGKASGKVKGAVVLVPVSPDLPLQKLWAGSVRVDGKMLFMLLQLTDNGDGTVGGHAVVDGESGTVVATADRPGGRRAGVSGTIKLNSGDLDIDLSLQKGNNQLGGKIIAGGKNIKAKLKPAGSKGKPMKVTGTQRAALRDLAAGQANTITVRGKNFVAGANVHVDNGAFSVDSVEFKSSKQLEVVITPAASVANGTSAGVLVVNADGQTGERANALTVTSDDGGGGATVSFAADIQPIFDQNCALAGCHSAASASAGLVLAAGSAFDNLVGAPSSQQPATSRVASGDPDNSYLVRKIEGAAGISGGRMPQNRPPLSAAQIASIRTWITEGAQNNRRPQ